MTQHAKVKFCQNFDQNLQETYLRIQFLLLFTYGESCVNTSQAACVFGINSDVVRAVISAIFGSVACF